MPMAELLGYRGQFKDAFFVQGLWVDWLAMPNER